MLSTSHLAHAAPSFAAQTGKEAELYIGSCDYKDIPKASCEKLAASFRASYTAAWAGNHSAIREVAAVLSNDKRLTYATSPFMFNGLQGCAWAIVAADPSFAGTAAEDESARDRECLGLAGGYIGAAQARADVILAVMRDHSLLRPPIAPPQPLSAAGKAADVRARAEVANYLRLCANLGAADARKLCFFDRDELVYDYRRAMAGDLEGQENISTLLFDGGTGGAITPNKLQSCAWAVVAADPQSAEPSEADAMNLHNRCDELTSEQQATALDRGRLIIQAIHATPHSVVPDEESPPVDVKPLGKADDSLAPDF